MNRLIFFLIVFLFIGNISSASIQTKIIVNVGNQIVTSYELKNRVKTILILSNKEIDQDNINKTKGEALSFLINLKLKNQVVSKYNATPNNKSVSDYLNNISSNYKTDKKGFKNIFENNNISYDLFLKGIETEFAWQQLIFDLHREKINLNEKEIDLELEEVLKKQKKSVEYNLAEIEILLENNSDDKQKIQEVKKKISEIGFEDTAIKYSRSVSSIEGGNLGWITSQALSNIILNSLQKINTGDITEPIIQSNTALFIKLLDKREKDFNEINLKKMKEQIVSQKRNELLNLFSNSYLSKIKNNTLIQYNEK